MEPGCVVRRLIGLCAACITLAQTSPASAHWTGVMLGTPFSRLKLTYPEAVETGRVSTGSHALELPALSYSGVQWSGARLVFNAADKLDHVTFEAHGLDYNFVKAQVGAAFRTETPLVSAIRSEFAPASFVEMRICQMEDDSINVTFEEAHSYS